MKQNRLLVALLLCCMLAFAGCNKEEKVSSSKKTEEQVDDVQKAEEKDVVTALMDEKLSKKEEKTDSKRVKPETVVVNTQKDPETKDVISASDPQVPFDISHPEVIENGEVEYSDDTIMVKFSNSFDGTIDDELKNAGVAKLEVLFELENATWYTAYLNKSAKVEDTLTNVRAYSKTIVAEYNFAYETTSTSSVDEAFNGAINGNHMHDKQKVFHSCHIKDAWKHCHDKKQVGGGSSSVVVAVIDTGVDYEHVDLKANMWKNQSEIDGNNKDDDGNGYVDDYYGIDVTAGKGSAMDDNGHGTHVAGIIGASNNKEGVVGIAYNTKIMPIKAGDASGYFLQANIAKAIIYAYEHGADVINMSFGGSAASIAVQDALAVAYSRCVLVASAGNDGMPNESADNYPIPSPNYPAALSYVIGVMSTDFKDVESSFTNWDTTLYNSVEYEVYAPGNEILSTIPGDKYAELSGTSMAAPVVASQAAILRSFYSDADTYPTKFIYGQIVGTADPVVQCLNPEKHTVGGYPHNIPGRVNFIRSIEELPTPDIGMSDYTIFDTETYVADTKGITSGQLESNNGDGRIDSGEVIALGFTLKNRWGMSKDTVVHIDSTTEAGVAHPYVTFLNNDINYESIGTYSQSDSGKLYSEDGQMWTGWENPFYIKIDKDCPNEYSITLNISITYKNGLDESDRTTYTTKDKILLIVRRGTILPNKISEDMTLTKDNYYIIPNSMIVMEGATLTVEEGTKVQFWCSDPEDAYADEAIVFIKVLGNLICEGTEEEPIEMFPSDWMGRYRVEIYTELGGYASLKYTNVVNPYLIIDVAENCEFRQNYRDYLHYRELYQGVVQDSSNLGESRITMAKECCFYQLGTQYKSGYYLSGDIYEKCIFVDCSLNLNTIGGGFLIDVIRDCVFYGNNNYNDTTEGGTSRYIENKLLDTMSVEKIFTNTDTERTYIVVKGEHEGEFFWNDEVLGYVDMWSRFAKKVGGHLYAINSIDEFNWVNRQLDFYEAYALGVVKNQDAYYNYNGDVLPEEFSKIIDGECRYGYLYGNKLSFETEGWYDNHKVIIEIPSTDFLLDVQGKEWTDFIDGGHNTRFYNNTILNRLNDDDTSRWFRITAPEASEYITIGLGGNYWGTTNMYLINKQIFDFDDYQTLADINVGEILTEAPEDTFPFVVDAYLETDGERVDTIGNELVTFVVEFNRDMDTSIDLRVCFGSAYPYADYTIEGSYATPRQWRGTMKLSTIIENGYQYWSVSNGKAAGTSMKLYTDWGRFPFKIDTSSAQALTMQAEATEAGIKLTWQQDDFETLAGYNVYRSTKEDGQYTKINRTVIPADTMEWFDDTVEPGQRYYYNFTVVQTDMSESEPSGKVTVSAFDTMAPNIYHSPVYHAFTGSNLVISATVTDNVALEEVTLYYRTLGTEEWHSKTMTNNNDKYSAVISSDYITVAGLEYYIDATDGIAHTYKGSAQAPYQVTVQVAVSGSDLGDVDGNGAIEIKDAMMLLMAINDRLNLTEEQFARADIDGNGELAAKEALRIIQYVNGTITSILM